MDAQTQNFTLLVQGKTIQLTALGTALQFALDAFTDFDQIWKYVVLFILTGLYRNSPLHKLMTFTLDINSVKHIDLLMELKIQNEKYGRLYLPNAYLDINSRRIAELEGTYSYRTPTTCARLRRISKWTNWARKTRLSVYLLSIIAFFGNTVERRMFYTLPTFYNLLFSRILTPINIYCDTKLT